MPIYFSRAGKKKESKKGKNLKLVRNRRGRGYKVLRLTSREIDQIRSTNTILLRYPPKNTTHGYHLRALPARGTLIRQDQRPIASTVRETVMERDPDALARVLGAKPLLVNEVRHELLANVLPLAVAGGTARRVRMRVSGSSNCSSFSSRRSCHDAYCGTA